jgi:hypothetical protein
MDIEKFMAERKWMRGANPLSFLDNKPEEPCYVCGTVTPLRDLAAIHGPTNEAGADHFGLCKNCIDKLPTGYYYCGCGG